MEERMVFYDDYNTPPTKGLYYKYNTKKEARSLLFALHCNFYVLAVTAEGYDLRCVGGRQKHLLRCIASVLQPT